ncbi:MAG: hypothetical protein HYU99_07100 [Deltaproteobacteria bacterium]|nr:hypothetical protein [Deltaproteobacteria bacterium]
MKHGNLKIRVNDDIDMERIKYFKGLSVRKKLDYLEQLNLFFNRITPAKSKKIWEKLKQQGF